MQTLSAKQIAYLRDQRPPNGGNHIRLALGLLGETQEELSAATGIQPSNLSLIINGKYRRLALDTARRIAVAFGACIEDIFPPPCTARGRRRAA